MQIDELVDKLEHLSEKYYSGTPEVGDDEYDVLLDELRAADPGNAFFSKVGATGKTGTWEKVIHRIPMGSLDKIMPVDNDTGASMISQGAVLWWEKTQTLIGT
jgi:NAD-dependent DNA ligase